MASGADRPFAPSPRRRALARAAGLTGASPAIVAAAAWAGALVALLLLGRAIAARLASWIATAASGEPAALGTAAPAGGVADPARSGFDEVAASAASLPRELLALAVPALAAAALAAFVVHVAQTRALWFPRRKLRNAPALDTSRTQRAGLELAAAFAVGAVAVSWLWACAPRLARLVDEPAQAAWLLLAFAASLAVVWIVFGALDALLRHAELARSLRMTAQDKREDERLAGADPRWAQRRKDAQRTPTPARDAIAASSLLLLGDGTAVAIAWDPVRRPLPIRTATGTGARATQLLALARRARLPVHRDTELAAALAGDDGPVPESRWSRLAEIVAATARRTGSI
jgi:flagellar biosynthesis protein FlhB